MMQAVKAIYEDGKIELLSPIQGIKRAKLIITVLDDEDSLSEDDSFLVSAYDAVIEADSKEDEIWESYLHAR